MSKKTSHKSRTKRPRHRKVQDWELIEQSCVKPKATVMGIAGWLAETYPPEAFHTLALKASPLLDALKDTDFFGTKRK